MADEMEDASYMGDLDDMDDLFLEAPSALAPPPPVNNSLLQRLGELSASGCCEKLSWSKLGAIAHVSRDGKTVKIHPFVRDAAQKDFRALDVRVVEVPVAEEAVVTNVTWSHPGHDLAIVDSSGMLYIYTTFVALNEMKRLPIRSSTIGLSDTLGSIIGLEWMAANRAVTWYAYTSRMDDRWSCSPVYLNKRGPCHPNPNRGALMAVTRSGVLRLVYHSFSENDKAFDEASTSLFPPESSTDLLTHASFSAEADGIFILATRDSSSTVRVYRVRVDWHILPEGPNKQQGQREAPHPSGPPSIEVARIHTLNTQWLDDNGMSDGSDGLISHFQLLPSTTEPLSNERAPTTLMIVYGIADATLQLENTPPLRSTRVLRWEFREEQEKLHSCFDQLSVKKNSSAGASPKQVIRMKRLEDVNLAGTVISLNTMRMSTVVAFFLADGSADIRDRLTLLPIDVISDGRPINHLINAGFVFPPRASCSEIVLSPNQCLAVARGKDDDLEVRYLEHASQQHEGFEIECSEDLISGAVALLFAASCVQLHNNDDILAFLQKSVDIDIERILTSMFLAVNVAVDATTPESLDRIVKTPIVTRCLSVLHSLGWDGHSRSVAAKTAWIAMNLRAAYWSFYAGMGSLERGDLPDRYRQDIPTSLLGVVKWFFDLTNLIVDDLMTLSRKLRGREGDRDAVNSECTSMNSSSLVLLLGGIGRTYLHYNCRYVRTLVEMARKRTQNLANTDAKPWRTFLSVVFAGPVKAFPFETVLAEIDHHVKATYEQAGINEQGRADVERTMLVTGQIAETVMPVAQRVLTTTLNKLLDEIDPIKVHFHDVRWLGLTEDRRTREARRGRRWDVHRKVELRATTRRVRMCTRCGSVTEHATGSERLPQWVLIASRSCICSNPWVLHDDSPA